MEYTMEKINNLYKKITNRVNKILRIIRNIIRHLLGLYYEEQLIRDLRYFSKTEFTPYEKEEIIETAKMLGIYKLVIPTKKIKYTTKVGAKIIHHLMYSGLTYKEAIEREMMALILLDGSDNVIGGFLVTKGITREVSLPMDNYFLLLLKTRTKKLVIAHNHPPDTKEEWHSRPFIVRQSVSDEKFNAIVEKFYKQRYDILVVNSIIVTCGCLINNYYWLDDKHYNFMMNASQVEKASGTMRYKKLLKDRKNYKYIELKEGIESYESYKHKNEDGIYTA